MHRGAAGSIRIAVAAVVAAAALAAGTARAAEPAKPQSSCVACHTDVERLKAEAAKVIVPTGSTLQSGKG